MNGARPIAPVAAEPGAPLAGAVVFLGPSLPEAAARPQTGFRVLPPARQGDVFRAVRAWRPAAIGLVDGVFLDVPAIWHREILWAMGQGVRVFGAASMGALRAAELHAFGMVGIGRVFTAFRDGVWPGFPDPFEDDDEVAVLHAPPQAGGAALSDAMVDIRATLLAAAACGLIGRESCLALAAAAKALHFSARHLDDLPLGHLPPGHLSPDRASLLAVRVYQKRDDALALLRAMHDAAPGWSQPFVPPFRFERALVWERFERAALAAERAAALAAKAAKLARSTETMRPEDVNAWLR